MLKALLLLCYLFCGHAWLFFSLPFDSGRCVVCVKHHKNHDQSGPTSVKKVGFESFWSFLLLMKAGSSEWSNLGHVCAFGDLGS